MADARALAFADASVHYDSKKRGRRGRYSGEWMSVTVDLFFELLSDPGMMRLRTAVKREI